MICVLLIINFDNVSIRYVGEKGFKNLEVGVNFTFCTTQLIE